MLRVNNISKSYKGKTILNQIGFTLNSGEKIGLVGCNGVGKSTLMRIISGIEKADEGTIEIDNPEFVGYLRQEFKINEENETIVSFLKKEIGIDDIEAD